MSGVIPAWPARFVDPLPIRLRPSSQLYSARCADDGSPCVVLLPGHEADLTAVHAAFDRIAAAHAVLSAPCIPAVRARGVDRGTPWLQFDCDAVIDGTELVRLIGDSEVRIRMARPTRC